MSERSYTHEEELDIRDGYDVFIMGAWSTTDCEDI